MSEGGRDGVETRGGEGRVDMRGREGGRGMVSSEREEQAGTSVRSVPSERDAFVVVVVVVVFVTLYEALHLPPSPVLAFLQRT